MALSSPSSPLRFCCGFSSDSDPFGIFSSLQAREHAQFSLTTSHNSTHWKSSAVCRSQCAHGGIRNTAAATLVVHHKTGRFLSSGNLTKLATGHGVSLHVSGLFSFTSTDHFNRVNNLGVVLSAYSKPLKYGVLEEPEKGWLCKCSTGIGELGSLVAMDWKPAHDQFLMVLSIALAYIAGVNTPAAPANSVSNRLRERPATIVHKRIDDFLNVQAESAEQVSLLEEDIWNGVRSKLAKSIAAADRFGHESLGQWSQLSLQAIARGPRLRLLLIALEHLQEICNLQSCRGPLDLDWTSTSVKILCGSVVSICKTWVSKEHIRKVNDQIVSTEGMLNVVLGSLVPEGEKSNLLQDTKEGDLSQWNSTISSYLESSRGDTIMMENLKMTVKAEFYADFLHFLCFKTIRDGSSCSLKTLRNYKKAILEDLLIAVADGAAALYLDLISADYYASGESQWSDMINASISSTRTLERFRNEVALHNWLNMNFYSVRAMFEDRIDSWILNACNFDIDDVKSDRLKRKRKQNQNQESSRGPPELVLDQFKIPIRRVKELRALSGWRYYYSLYLEFSDVVGPLLKTIITKLGEGISFLLVILIGRSLGLIYRGIRQSVQWTSK